MGNTFIDIIYTWMYCFILWFREGLRCFRSSGDCFVKLFGRSFKKGVKLGSNLLWQYQLYYILLGVYVVISSLLLYLWQKKIRNAEGGIIVWVLHIIWVLFFILGWMISI